MSAGHGPVFFKNRNLATGQVSMAQQTPQPLHASPHAGLVGAS